MRTAITVIAILAAGYLVWATMLFFMQRSMMFPGAGLMTPGGRDSRAGAAPADVERYWIDSYGGEVEAWLLKASDSSPSPAAIFAHGNAELIDYALVDARELRAFGLSVLLVEYPGYGRSGGDPTRASIAEVFLAAYDSLVARPDIDRDRVVGFGRSLGAGVITDLARERPLRALVLQSPFTSVADLAKRYLVPPVLARDAFDNMSVVNSFRDPILLVHGRHDRIIPYSNSERLARAAPDAELLTLECGHNDCPPDPDAYLEALGEFLERAGILPRESDDPGAYSATERQ